MEKTRGTPANLIASCSGKPGDSVSFLASVAPARQKGHLRLAAMVVPLSRCPSSSILPMSCSRKMASHNTSTTSIVGAALMVRSTEGRGWASGATT